MTSYVIALLLATQIAGDPMFAQSDRAKAVTETLLVMGDQDRILVATAIADADAMATLRSIETALSAEPRLAPLTAARDSVRQLLENEPIESEEMTRALRLAQEILDNAMRHGSLSASDREAFHHRVVDAGADRVRRNGVDLMGRLLIMRDVHDLSGTLVKELERGLFGAAKQGL